MTINKTRINLLVVLLPLVILFVTGGYFFYATWVKYTSSLKLEQRLGKVELLQSLEQSIYAENICTAQMSGDRGSLKETCQKYRDNTDTIVSKLMQDSTTVPLAQKINTILFHTEESNVSKFSLLESGKLENILKDIRYNIDISKKLPLEMFIDGEYHKQIISPVESYWKEFNQYSTVENKYLFVFLEQINKLYTYSITETTFGAYFLSNNKVFTSNDLAQWDRYITLSVLPDIEEYHNISAIKPQLLELFSEEKKEKIINKIDDMRIDILMSHTTGEYESTSTDWVSYNKEKQKLLQDSKIIVLEHLSSKLQEIIQKDEIILAISAAISLFGLFLFIYNIMSELQKSKEDEDALAEMMEEIEILTKESKKEVLDTESLLEDFSNKKQVYAYIRAILKLLHQKELQAEEANTAKDLFLANMSHEIRTPLNGIVGFTQLLKDSPLNQDQKEFITIIENSSDSLLSIVSDILDISKINANKMEFEYISFDLYERAESAIETFLAKADEKGIELGVMIDPRLPRYLIGDPTKITQVLVNLISNAIKFTSMDGAINLILEYVTSDEKRCSIKFIVKDDGIGITEEQKENIFKAFTQADSSTSRKFGGTGLGLTISKTIISYMGGTLDVYSEENEGAEFFFTVELEKDINGEEPIYPECKDVSIAIALPDLDAIRDIDRYLKNYIEYMGGSLEYYSYSQILDPNKRSSMPDILFVDHRYLDEEKLELFLALESYIVVMVTGKFKNILDKKNYTFTKIMHKPITIGKIARIIESYDKNEEVVVEVEESSLKTDEFGDIHALVAEDNIINQKLIRATLENFNIEVTLTGNGQEAYEKRKSGNYDIIFMDIQMPIMGGIDATKEILNYEKEHNLEHIPIVALTANALKGDREKYIEAGMDNYASKPLNLLELKHIISKYFAHGKETKVSTPKIAIQEKSENRENIEIEDLIVPTHEPELILETSDETVMEEENKIHTILLYNTMQLQSNIYRSIFKNFGYEVDIVRDNDSFLDSLESKSYTFAMYDEHSFDQMDCSVADIAKDSGAIPIIFVEQEKNGSFCAKTLTRDCGKDTILEKLQQYYKEK